MVDLFIREIKYNASKGSIRDSVRHLGANLNDNKDH